MQDARARNRKKCKLESAEETEIPANFKEAQLEENGERIIDSFEPVGATNTWMTIRIERRGTDSCTLEGSWLIKGSQYCEVDNSNSEAETFNEEHELICNASGSDLQVDGAFQGGATLWTTGDVKLSGGDYWAIK